MTVLLYTFFFASGVSALLFEMLWFRQAGLAFGNSVWASSLVLSGFMGGLALGNAAGARYGARFRHPVRAYAVAEVTIALTGVALVYLFPLLGAALAPWLRPWLDSPLALNPLRLSIAFTLLMIPSTAMGITLPVLTRAVMGRDPHFGSVLGRLYGWNTLGAVTGVIAGETFLVGAYGVRGTALLAGALNLIVAAVSMWLSSRWSFPLSDSAAADRKAPRRVQGQARGLAAAFLAGFCLLALEVVWFRFLLLFVKGHSAALALILGVVLTGIALGGLSAGAWLRRVPGAHSLTAPVAFLAGLVCVVSYAAFPRSIEFAPSLVADTFGILRVGAPLMFPVSFLSGVLFTLLGAALRTHRISEAETAGVLTLANTTGAALGSLTAGFVLLPVLGMERSFFLIAVLYGGLGVMLSRRAEASRGLAYAAAAVFLLGAARFPFGAMESRLLEVAVRPWRQADVNARIVAVREGLTETIVYFERQLMGRPVSHALLTNAFSMSATGYGARRYMKLYVYWPMAVHPNLKRALLIGYGVGNTAKAMTDSRSLETIDVVDLSRDILDMNRVVYPDPADQPLNDPRVRVHIEDGRYLLQATDRRFDLITGEPPPPGIAGVEHLYSREYFQLIHARLADGGIVTYWLPLSDLTDVSAKAILGAFCDAFDDCSLWNGSGTHLMMVGTRNAAGPVSEEAFARQWHDPLVAAELQRIGFEQPEQLGALFIGDREYVARLVGDTPSLTDNHPKLIEAPSSSREASSQLLHTVADTAAARERFERSALVAHLWPARWLAASLPYFEFQGTINTHMYGELLERPSAIQEVHGLLTRSTLTAPVLWRLGSNADIQRIVAEATPRELTDPLLQFHLGVRLLSERQYAAAADALTLAAAAPQVATPGAASTGDNAFALYVYALCMAGQTREAQDAIRGPWEKSLRDRGLSADAAAEAPLPPFWLWMRDTFGIDPRMVAAVR
jgi:predicted membrane-bound spermidine synthase